MKKKNLKSLLLNKKVISSLDIQKSVGGNIDNSIKECIRTIDVGGINICFETLKRTCGESVIVDCITQTELPTCRNCD